MDSQNKNTVFGHAASCARLNECTSTAPASSLRAQLRQSCTEINAVYRLIEARFGSAASMPSSCRWLLDNRYLALREAKRAGGALRDVRRLRAGGDGVILSVLCRDMIKVCSGKLSEDNMLEYLAGFQSVSPLVALAGTTSTVLQYVWCGFRVPSGFYSRVAVFFVLSCIWMAGFAAKDLQEKRLETPALVAGGAVALALPAIALAAGSYSDLRVAVLGMAIAAAAAVLLVVYLKATSPLRASTALLLAPDTGEMTLRSLERAGTFQFSLFPWSAW